MGKDKKGSGRVVVVDWDFLLSEAWWDLEGKDQQVLFEFLRRRQIKKREVKVDGKWQSEPVIENQGEITFTYKEAQTAFHLNAQRFSAMLDRLTEHGFIEVATSGMGMRQVTTKFNVLVGGVGTDEKWRKFGEPGFRPPKRKKRKTHVFASGEANPRHEALRKKKGSPTRKPARRQEENGEGEYESRIAAVLVSE